ncbi:MAG: ketoacyl-ACP synthase III [Planctomycetaceae bacterium]|nr:ketoacyl-ACP synthase III [Planctomycetaceae bacterium]
MRSLTGVQLLSTGSYVPPDVVTNEDLRQLGYDSDWIIQRTGIQSRRRASADMATSDLAYEAAQRCLDASGTDAADIDLIVLATMTPDAPIPSTACLLQERLAASQAGAMDLNAACAGFMYALLTGAQFIGAGTCQRVLVVGADVNTRIVNPADEKTFPLFGDGAGAVLLGPGDENQGLLAYTMGADGSGADLLRVPGGGSRRPLTPQSLAAGEQFIQMDGRPVFKWAVRTLTDTLQDVLAHANCTWADIKQVVLHQANIRIIEAAAEALDIPREKMLINVDRFGNTSAGSIPLGLDESYGAGNLSRGDRVLLCGFGAGLAWGAAVVQW